MTLKQFKDIAANMDIAVEHIDTAIEKLELAEFQTAADELKDYRNKIVEYFEWFKKWQDLRRESRNDESV